jgi:hypothetical protein
MALTIDVASKFARIALGHIAREYPHKLDHVMGDDADVLPPRSIHPCFFGSYDWHSCVHGWWTLLTVRRLFPDIPEAAQIDELAEQTFTEEKLAVEHAYLQRPLSRGFERPYGWAWLLYLQLEAERHTDHAWGIRLAPLAHEIAGKLETYLGVLTYPITVGTHFNSAFALILARDWAVKHDTALLVAIDTWALSVFGGRRCYSGWEPGGDEFLSPVLTVAQLISQIMPREEFAPWFSELVLKNGWIERECRPVSVSDRSDGKIAHLDGLNLSRAWCLRGVSNAIDDQALRELIHRRAREHLDAALLHVSGDYMGEHWLATFALLALIQN